jgi:hypothetical protein
MVILGDVLANISDALQKRFLKRLIYQFSTLTPTLQHIYKEKGFGESLNFDGVFPGSAGGSTPEGYVYASADFTVNKNVRANLGWGIYSQPFAITDLEFSAIKSTNDPEMLTLNFLDRKMKEAIQTLATKINGDIFVGAGSDTSDIGSVASTPRIVGLTPAWANGTSIPGGITSDTGSYAGISRTTYTGWKGNYISNSANTVLSPDLIDHLLTQIFQSCGRYPNLLVGSPNVGRYYRQLFTTTGSTPIFNMINAASGKLDPMIPFSNVNNGYNQNLSYGGIPVVIDPSISEIDGTAGKLYALNTDYLGLYTLPYGAPGFERDSLPVKSLVHGIDEESTETEEPEIPVTIKQLAVTGLQTSWSMVTQVQLAVTRPQANGWMANLKVS